MNLKWRVNHLIWKIDPQHRIRDIMMNIVKGLLVAILCVYAVRFSIIVVNAVRSEPCSGFNADVCFVHRVEQCVASEWGDKNQCIERIKATK